MKKAASLALAILMAAAALPVLAAEEAVDLCLCLGSPIALSGGQLVPLDEENPRLTPILYKGRTLVPLRMIGEYFGAEVAYDDDARAAVIVHGGKTARFPIDEAAFTLDGESHRLDTEAIIRDGRTLVPLRAICETVLGLEVAYEEGIIRIGVQASLDAETAAQVRERIGRYVRATDVEALQDLFAAGGYYYDGEDVWIDEVEPPMMTPMEEPDFAPEMSMDNAEASATSPTQAATTSPSDDFAETNVQVAGVDEGDIIKTDGKYIYICSGADIQVIRADGADLSVAAGIKLEAGATVREMYVDGDYLTITGQRRVEINEGLPEGFTVGGRGLSFVRVYDMSDMADVKLHRVFEIEGSISSTRKQGDWLYLLTGFGGNGRGHDPRPLLPDGDGFAPMPVGDILVPGFGSASQMVTLSAVNIKDAGVAVTGETVLAGGNKTYMSNSAFYLADTHYRDGKYQTGITRFTVDGGKVGYGGTGTVTGSVLDQFSMDEYQGHLRIATSVSWPRTNNLYILDGNMEVCGSVEGYAPDERIYSARFMGERGYVVTFRQMDPLFVFDLSDPKKPVITGELKVPGFSNYLHPVSETVLLGVGQDVADIYYKDDKGNEVVVGTRQGGVKLSLFDVSDAGKPREIDTLVLGDQGYSPLQNNHKTAMFKAADSLLALPVDLYWLAEGRDPFRGMALISYEENRLEQLGGLEYENPTAEGGRLTGVWYTTDRTVYIGDVIYYLQDGLLRAFDQESLKELGRVELSPMSK